MRGGSAGSRSPCRYPSAASASARSPAVTPSTLGGTLVRDASNRPAAAGPLRTATGPEHVRNRTLPAPSRVASATAAATVAWPQKGTSASGLK